MGSQDCLLLLEQSEPGHGVELGLKRLAVIRGQISNVASSHSVTLQSSKPRRTRLTRINHAFAFANHAC